MMTSSKIKKEKLIRNELLSDQKFSHFRPTFFTDKVCLSLVVCGCLAGSPSECGSMYVSLSLCPCVLMSVYLSLLLLNKKTRLRDNSVKPFFTWENQIMLSKPPHTSQHIRDPRSEICRSVNCPNRY